jgi:hypothetical protein
MWIALELNAISDRARYPRSIVKADRWNSRFAALCAAYTTDLTIIRWRE